MKLSEREFINQYPRNLDSSDLCMKTVSVIYDKYNSKMLKVIEFLVGLYIYDCTIPFDKAAKKAQEKFSVSKKDIIEYLKDSLLAPYSHDKNHTLEISSKIFNQSFYSLEEAKEGLKDYLDNPNMLLQHLAYFSSFHSSTIENFLTITLKLSKGNDIFIILSEAIYLLSIRPNFTKDSLTHILTCRLGISSNIIENSLNFIISTHFDIRVQEYLKKKYGLKSEDTFFELCYKKAVSMQTSNFPSQF